MNKYTIVKKAYTVWHQDMLDDTGFLFKDARPFYYADAPGKAKMMFLTLDAKDHLKNDGDCPKYVDLIAERRHGDDMVEAFGETMPLRKAKEWEFYENRAAAIEAEADEQLFYFQNGFYGDDLVLWRLDSGGYTHFLENAQLYTKTEALEHCWLADLVIWKEQDVKAASKTVIDSEVLRKTGATSL